MRASFADPRPPFGISSAVILCYIINNPSGVTLHSYSKQAPGLYTADDRLAKQSNSLQMYSIQMNETVQQPEAKLR